jgi:hypothetical protein
MPLQLVCPLLAGDGLQETVQQQTAIGTADQ